MTNRDKRIIILEDEPAHAEAVLRALTDAGFASIQTARTLKDYRLQLERFTPDVVLADMNLSDGTVLEILHTPMEEGPFPILVMTSHGNEQKAVQIIKSGALDYVVKSPQTFAQIPHILEQALKNWRNIKEKQQAEERVKERERQFALLFNHMAQGVIYRDMENKIIAANPAALDILGVTLDDLRADPAFDSQYPARREDGAMFLPEEYPSVLALKTGIPVTNVVMGVFNPQQNANKWIVVDAVPEFQEGAPVPYRVCISFFDITDRKFAEETLRERERMYDTLIQNLPGVIYRCRNDRDWTMLYVSPGCLALTGYAPEDLIENHRTSYNQLILPEYRESLWTKWQGALAGHDHFEDEYPIRTANGNVKWVWERGQGIYDNIGQLLFLEGYIADITERKNLEEQLQQKNKMDAIGQLAGGVAHDYNNQLAVIMGYADMLAQMIDDQRLRLYAEHILHAASRSKDLTQQLLAFARKGKYQMIAVNVHKVINDVIDFLSHSIDKRIKIKQNLYASPPLVLGDPTQIQNAVLNLALNARDAMPKGGELIFTTDNAELDENYCRRHPYDIVSGKYLKICVTDTGIGMTKEVQARIFEPFFTTKEIGKGIGMGLPSVYGTVKNHRGAVRVYSEPGKGSTFTLYFPVAEIVAEDDSDQNKEKGAVKGNAHILLVDDEEMVITMAKDMLEGLGYKVTTKVNGKEALEYYKRYWQNVDMVLLDMVMPELAGRETYVEMKKINPNIKAILSSGYSLNGDAQEILDEGVQAFVQKPYILVELSRKINEVLKR